MNGYTIYIVLPHSSHFPLRNNFTHQDGHSKSVSKILRGGNLGLLILHLGHSLLQYRPDYSLDGN